MPKQASAKATQSNKRNEKNYRQKKKIIWIICSNRPDCRFTPPERNANVEL